MKEASRRPIQASGRPSRARIFVLALLGCSSLTASAAEVNLAQGAEVTSSSARPGNPAGAVADGLAADDSRWLATQEDKLPWVELAFPKPVKIGVVDVFSGWQDEPGLAAFDLTFEVDGKPVVPPEGKVRGVSGDANARRVEIGLQNVTRMRLTLAGPGPAKIREIAIYSHAGAVMGSGLMMKKSVPVVDRTIHQIGVNQVGYETGKPKRFTAPLSPDGSPFTVLAETDPAILHQGVIRGGVGDFSAFRPADSATRYVVEVSGGSLKDGRSDPFLIRGNLYQEQFWQPAVDFLIDARSVVGTHPSAFGGCPWRDGTYYDAILPALVLFYLADREVIDAMPRQIDWAADKARVTDPKFRFDPKNPCSEGVMDAVRNYYQLEPPKADAPDVVKMIHWGAGFYLVNPATQDPSQDPDKRKIHSQTVEQVAYVVWAWPVLKQWLPESFYEKCKAFCFANWKPSLEIDRWWEPKTYLTVEQVTGTNPMGGLLHPFKGRHAPGHSIVPNLLMHEIAKREKRDDAAVYLEAAVRQAAWCVEHLDWNDPRTTKGHRMSEHRTIPNLVWILQHYPDQAPAGLKGKIDAWVDVALSRADNFWDFRRYDLGDHWTIPKINDVGNTLSLPACLIAASWVVDPSKRRRIEEVAFASIDHVWGRNPRLAAAPALPAMGFPEVERGWPIQHKINVCARLELCRGSISALPGSEMYPFNPEGGFRHAEGWVNYGASWCISLSYLRFDAAKATPRP
jgi:hypothetical protein